CASALSSVATLLVSHLPFSLSVCIRHLLCSLWTAPSDISTLSLHDALPILAFSAVKWAGASAAVISVVALAVLFEMTASATTEIDRKSTRLNSSHQIISYAVFCLKKKN